MNIPNIEKITKSINICLDINSHIFESSACMERLPKTVTEGLSLVYDLIVASIKMRDVDLLDTAYTMANNLIPDSELIDSVVFAQIKEIKDKFNVRVVNLLKQHPSFILKYKLVQMANKKRALTDAKARYAIEQDSAFVYSQIVLPCFMDRKPKVK